ncbi:MULTISPECIES: amidase domain-containing protein [unclassified Streptomyces]|uniref:amidase domain-containing protein n=1 Tax=unclassified Streptomyces TaxID=2593676 RepID=UPI00340E4024
MRSRTLSRCSVVAATVLSAALLPLSAAHAADASAPAAPQPNADSFGRIADAVLTDRTAALLDRPQLARTAQKAQGNVRLSPALSRTENTTLASVRGTRARLAEFGEAYSDADTEVTVDSTRVEGQRATVRVTEATILTYRKIRGDEPPTTGFTAHHELTFTAQTDGTWQLEGVRRTDKGPRAVNEPVPAASSAPVRPTAIIDAPRAAITLPAPAKPKNLGSGTTYDYTAMATYAEKYWKNYNTAYRRFNSAGGDCTNYISQSLFAGGWKNDTTSTEDYDTWWYSTSGQSDSWIGVNEWSWFTQTAKRTTALANAYQMDLGDVLQVDFDKDGAKDHTMITSYRSTSGVPYLTYHDTDTYRRSLSSLISSYPNSAYYAYRT